MQPPSPKWFNLETSRPTSNYVTVGNPSYHPNTGSYLQKNPPKNQDNMFKSNLLTRYSSQQDLQSYARHKVVGEELDNSPKSQQNFIYKKTNYFPTRKSNNLDGKGVSGFIPSQVKRKSSIITGEPNVQYFKSPVFENKGIKYLKQTSSTSSTENIITGSRSEKAIPTFLKRTSQHKRTFQESALFKTRDMFASYHSKQPQLSIDSFEIIGKLGEGKFASVFMAMQKLTGFIVALKVVEKKRIIEENFLTQFIRQIKIQAYLDHPNIARIYGFFHDENYFYSILELGEGGQLYDIIKNGQTLSQESTSFIVGNLLDAISYIHDKKILHRDIKPENIVLVHGNVKLCDFGWAVYKKAELRSTFCGTPLYLPPELLNGDKYDEKVDLWALGVMAFELHLGSSPFNIESQQDLLKIITNEIEYPEDCHVSKNFKEFIGAVLQKDPKARPEAKKLKELKFIKRYKELQTCEELCQ